MPIIRTYLHLHAYINFDWAGDPHTHKSIAGFFLGQTLISWCAKKKIIVAQSSTEAKYHTLAIATAYETTTPKISTFSITLNTSLLS